MNAEIIPSFGTGQAFCAAGLDHVAGDRWLSNGTFKLGPHDTEANGHGNHRQWSLRTVRTLALMAAIHRAGASPSRAASWAELAIDRCTHLPMDLRNYAAFQNSGGVNILTIESANRFEDALDNLIAGNDSVIIVDLSRLFARVDERLAANKGLVGN